MDNIKDYVTIIFHGIGKHKQKYKLKVLSRFSLEQFFDSFPIALPAILHSFIRFESQVQMRVASIYFISVKHWVSIYYIYPL